MILKNDKGEQITGIKQLIRPEFGLGKKDKYGQPVVNWACLSEFADQDGFDKRNIENNGKYKIKFKLPYGSLIIRYGNETGHFTAPQGTKYEELAMPYIEETVEYNEYRVISSNLEVCVVEKGKVAPGFDSNGGGIQYLHPETIRASVKRGVLERRKI